MKIKVKDITTIASLSTLLFIQEQALTFLPNFQLTVFFLVLYSKILGCKKTIIIIFIHVVLDNLVIGSFSIIFMPFMFIGWVVIPISLNRLFKKVNSNIGLALISIPLSFIYCWVFIIPNILVFQIDPISYLVADFIWEIILSASSFISILLLYEPCSKILSLLIA